MKPETRWQRLQRNLRELIIFALIATSFVLYVAVIGMSVRAYVTYTFGVEEMSLTASVACVIGMLMAATAAFVLSVVLWGRGAREDAWR